MKTTGTNVYINDVFFDHTCIMESEQGFINVSTLTEKDKIKGLPTGNIYTQNSLIDYDDDEVIKISFLINGIRKTFEGRIMDYYEISIIREINGE